MAVVAGSQPLAPRPIGTRLRGALSVARGPPAQPARLSAHLARLDLRLVPDADALPHRDGDRPRPAWWRAAAAACSAASTTSTSSGPGILAARCMQTASFESTYPIMGKISWRRNYEAILATPMQVHHLLIGELALDRLPADAPCRPSSWSCSTLFGIPRTPLAVLAIPAAVLTGLAFAAPIIAFAATRTTTPASRRSSASSSTRSSSSAAPSSRSTQLPERRPARSPPPRPLYHGVALVRGAILDMIARRLAAARRVPARLPGRRPATSPSGCCGGGW